MRAYRVAYDGRPFHGFQRQPDVPTVSDALLDGLVSLDLLEAGGRTRPVPAGYAAAGRTDAGVSALAQTVAFEAPDWLTPETFDAVTPESIVVWAAADAPDEFHATHDARERRYRYLLAPPATGLTDAGGERRVSEAAVTRIRTAATALSGTHDYHNLTPDERNTERTVRIEIQPAGRFVATDVTAGGFPRQLVRRLATLLRAAASDDLPTGRIDRLLGPEPVEGPAGVPPARPEPLVLLAVRYDQSFTPDRTAVERGREAFTDRRERALTRAAVADLLADRLGGE